MVATTKQPGPSTQLRILNWALWDWGSAAFNAVIITFVFTPYLTKSVAATEEAGSSALGWSMAAAGFVIAVVTPAAGTRADSGGRHRLWLGVHTGIVVLTMLRSEEHTSELQSRGHLVCRLLLEKKKRYIYKQQYINLS